jgi:hypothetical protein
MSAATINTDLLNSDDWRERASVFGWHGYGWCRTKYAITYVVGHTSHGPDVHIKHNESGRTVLSLSPREARRLAIALLRAAEGMEARGR